MPSGRLDLRPHKGGRKWEPRRCNPSTRKTLRACHYCLAARRLCPAGHRCGPCLWLLARAARVLRSHTDLLAWSQRWLETTIILPEQQQAGLCNASSRITSRTHPPDQRPTNCSIAYADALTPPNRAHRHCSQSHFSARHLSKRVRDAVVLSLPLFIAVYLVFPRPGAIRPSLKLLLFSRPPATLESVAI